MNLLYCIRWNRDDVCCLAGWLAPTDARGRVRSRNGGVQRACRMGCGAVRGTEAFSACGGCDGVLGVMGGEGAHVMGGLRRVLGERCGER